MLKRNGIEAALAGRYPDRDARETQIREQVILRRATIGFDTVKDFAKTGAKVLYGRKSSMGESPLWAKVPMCGAAPTSCFHRRSPPRS
jgi:hypothetical protein